MRSSKKKGRVYQQNCVGLHTTEIQQLWLNPLEVNFSHVTGSPEEGSPGLVQMLKEVPGSIQLPDLASSVSGFYPHRLKMVALFLGARTVFQARRQGKGK